MLHFSTLQFTKGVPTLKVYPMKNKDGEVSAMDGLFSFKDAFTRLYDTKSDPKQANSPSRGTARPVRITDATRVSGPSHFVHSLRIENSFDSTSLPLSSETSVRRNRLPTKFAHEVILRQVGSAGQRRNVRGQGILSW